MLTHPSMHARTTPGKVAYRMAQSGAALTYSELDRRSNQGAHLFRSIGVEAGDHVAILMENCLTFLEVCWAAQRAGIFYTAVSRYLTADEIVYIVRDCGAKVLITSERCAMAASRLADGEGELALFTTGEPQGRYRSWDDERDAQPATPIADETAGFDMLYSSGTTGRPKGVRVTLKKAPITQLHGLMKVLCQDMIGMSTDSIYLSPAPLYHAAPLRFNMMSAALGGTSIVMEKFDAEEYLRLVEANGVTHSQLVPTMFVRMLKLPAEVRARYDVSSLRGAVHAAAPCPVEVKAQMIDWWGPILIEYYAGTEANGVTVASSQEWLEHPGTVGRAKVGTIKIIGEDDEELPAGEVGGVYFAEGLPFAYHNDPEKTARAHNAKGWSTLGDVGFLDEEGFLHLTDRRAFMIISGGVNIYPQETEDVLIGHPSVMDVAVFGIPDPEMGEKVLAVVQPRDMAEAGESLEADLLAYCAARLSPLKCPRRIEFMAELPRTQTGKLMKRVLRDPHWAEPAVVPHGPGIRPIPRRVRRPADSSNQERMGGSR